MAKEPKKDSGKRQSAQSSLTSKQWIKAFTVEQQLQRLAAWHEAIEARPEPSYATSNERLVDQWKILEAGDPSIPLNASFLLRGATHDKKPPLAQLFEYVEAGFYPPPDLLLTVLDAWKCYCLAASANELSLEEAFFGKPKPKAGNYAAQSLKKRKDLGVAFELGKLIAEGWPKDTAAAKIAEQYGGSEESIKKIKAIKPYGWRESEK